MRGIGLALLFVGLMLTPTTVNPQLRQIIGVAATMVFSLAMGLIIVGE